MAHLHSPANGRPHAALSSLGLDLENGLILYDPQMSPTNPKRILWIPLSRWGAGFKCHDKLWGSGEFTRALVTIRSCCSFVILLRARIRSNWAATAFVSAAGFDPTIISVASPPPKGVSPSTNRSPSFLWLKVLIRNSANLQPGPGSNGFRPQFPLPNDWPVRYIGRQVWCKSSHKFHDQALASPSYGYERTQNHEISKGTPMHAPPTSRWSWDMFRSAIASRSSVVCSLR